MARRRKGRAINGILLLNKPLHISSNDAVQRVKHLYAAAKAGHTGALDPLASGMLPICLGEATKFSQFLLDADKTYEVTATLGIRTTTSDADGEVVEQKTVQVSEQQIRQAVLSFVGQSKQIPSMFSALKHQGKPLYWYARQGIEIEREARNINVFSIQIESISAEQIAMKVHCSKGTYIRTLVDDLGQQLGCGAFVSRLHRSAVAQYPADKMQTIEELSAIREPTKYNSDIDWRAFTELDGLLLPIDTAVKALPKVQLASRAQTAFCNGNPASFIATTDEKPTQQVRVYDEQAEFLGVGEIISDTQITPKRVVVREPLPA